VAGFDGVAPGAQLLGLKVANNARGGVAVTGSIEHAMAYAARYAEQRGLRLVLNLSFGVGNELDGHAAIDSIVDAFLLAHPAIVFAISAGNDGPGLSTLGFPGSAQLALSTGAALPGAFAEPPLMPDAPHPPPPADVVGWWSARGGELAKPDLITPGVAFSTVPRFDRGREVKGGTSMAAPYAVGLAACLISGVAQEGRAVSAVEIGQALRVSGSPLAGATLLDQGAGEPRLEAAYRWLEAGHQGSQYSVRTSRGAAAAFRRDGLSNPGDTEEVFRVRHLAGLRAAQFALRSNVSWLQAPATLAAAPLETAIPVRYVPGRFTAPGVYTGVVRAWNPNDSVAGPLFALLVTIVVPYDLGIRPLVDAGRLIGPAQVQRYFLRVAHPGTTLETTVTLSDSGGAPPPTVRLYEPTGQPFRDADQQLLSPHNRSTMRLVVRGEDLVPGVYELDVIATPRAAVTTSVSAAIAPLALEENEGALEATNSGPATVVARVTALLLGAVREFDVTGREAPAESLSVRVPAWASQALIDVAMPRGQWSELTGFGVTEFDSTGQQVGQGPLNYPTGRQPLDVTALRGRPLLIELAPAFARADGAHAWRATVRVRFLLEDARPWDGAGRVSVVAGGRVRVPSLTPAASPLALPLPSGFRLLVETRLHAENVPGSSPPLLPDAVRR